MASTKQRRPDHPASLGDFVTSSTRTRFSVHTGEACAVIDGTDGRAHHVRFRVKPSPTPVHDSSIPAVRRLSPGTDVGFEAEIEGERSPRFR
jgi:hypothetical protein